MRALTDEREQAEKIELENPQTYAIDGALNWKNGDIFSFLYAALEYFEKRTYHQPEQEPSWRMFGKFLYLMF